MQETIIISVGGSMIVPKDGIDTFFLKKLNKFIRKNISRNRRFFLVAGGGNIAREYISAGKTVIHKLTNEDLDWLGIHSTHLNAHLLRTIFRDVAHPRIIQNYEKTIRHVHEPVVIAGGWKPGWSTDYCSVLLSKEYNSSLLINLSNIYYAYNKDPKKYKDAQKIEKTTWDYFETLVGKKWTPGLSAPFDPVATQLAKNLNLTVVITKGDNFRNLQRILDGESFKGTIIMPYSITPSYYDRQYYFGEKGEYKYIRGSSSISRWIRTLVAWYRALYLKLQFTPNRLLDIGCGYGEMVYVLRKLGVDAYGLEISKDAIDLANERVKPYIREGNIVKLPFKDNEFDMVVSFDVLEHIERSKLKKASRECVRVSSRYILHKIYTKDNIFITWFRRVDRSCLSIFSRGFWDALFSSIPKVALARKFFRLPRFIETIYFLKKV